MSGAADPGAGSSAGPGDAWSLFAQAQTHASRAQRAARRGDAGVYGPDGEIALCLVRAAESAFEWGRGVLLESRVPLPADDRRHRLVDIWQTLPRLCRASGNAGVALPDPHVASLADLDAWHDALKYRSDRAMEHLHQRLRLRGFIVDGREGLHRALSPLLATTTVATLGSMFEWAAATTGCPAPRSLLAPGPPV